MCAQLRCAAAKSLLRSRRRVTFESESEIPIPISATHSVACSCGSAGSRRTARGDGPRVQLRHSDSHALTLASRENGRRVRPPQQPGGADERGRDVHRQPSHARGSGASRLRHCTAPRTVLGRLTDDRFLLLMRNEDEMHLLTQLARKIRQRLTRPIALVSTITHATPKANAQLNASACQGGSVHPIASTTLPRPASSCQARRAIPRRQPSQHGQQHRRKRA